jgi:hypothetical protein
MVDHRHRGMAKTFVLGVALLAGDAPAADDAQNDVQGQTAIARPSSMITASGKPDRIDFDFGEIKAWLREKGSWHIEGPVPHQGLLCATRELGVRFGIGKPGCTNVQWISEVDYGTLQKQCNNATAMHNGGGSQQALEPDFTRITCAERVIKCGGNCK